MKLCKMILTIKFKSLSNYKHNVKMFFKAVSSLNRMVQLIITLKLISNLKLLVKKQ